MTKKPSHLILLTTDFKPNIGGIAEYLHSLWQELSYLTNATVISIIPDKNQNWTHQYQLKILSSSPPQSTSQDSKSTILQTWNFLRDFHPQKEIIPFIKSLDRDSSIQVFIGVWHPISHFWCGGLRQAKINYSCFVYGKELLDSHYQALASQRVDDICHAQKIYACSQATGELVKSVISANLITQTIYPGINSPPDQTLLAKQAILYKQQLNLSSQPILFSLARLVYRKGIDLVLESLACLRQTFPHFTYLIAGDGEERAKLEQLAINLGISDHVLFLGTVDDLTKATLFYLCDVFVLPIRQSLTDDWEGFGITFLEAAMAKKPSIGGKTGGVVEAIEDSVTGFLVDTSSSQETQKAIAKLLENPDLRQKMGLAAEKHAEKFTWQNSASLLWDSLQKD